MKFVERVERNYLARSAAIGEVTTWWKATPRDATERRARNFNTFYDVGEYVKQLNGQNSSKLRQFGGRKQEMDVLSLRSPARGSTMCPQVDVSEFTGDVTADSLTLSGIDTRSSRNVLSSGARRNLTARLECTTPSLDTWNIS